MTLSEAVLTRKPSRMRLRRYNDVASIKLGKNCAVATNSKRQLLQEAGTGNKAEDG